jgi:hypothetical protein
MVLRSSLGFLLMLACGVSLAASPAPAKEAQPYPVAGVTPSQRPAGAPRISRLARDPEWLQHALRGVSAPYPASFNFLHDQGNWHTPFTQPGAPGPYDLRGWHK